ncbi:beta family protein [Vreelandella janggokensis]|uniref:beta family protein n=1 Tax=Vreelandella janggokensis TaxID=370767 RepID=UPI0028648EDC|nr:hypothetical protein [Halomonas janggokensis]MDR5885969.1 hypothetical protein [Halomonas janggokensis]
MARKHSSNPNYMPIIKWQKWEQKALSKTFSEIKEELTPCIEIRDASQHTNLLKNFQDVWGAPALVDYANPSGLLTDTRQNELEEFLLHSKSAGFDITPVFGPSEIRRAPHSLQKIATSFSKIAIRLRVSLSDLPLSYDRINELRDAKATISRNTDASFILDLGKAPENWNEASIIGVTSAFKNAKALGFNKVHLASGAYPDDLSFVRTGYAEIPRHDWAFWKAVNRSAPELEVGYSDYGILSPQWTEEALMRMSSRISIRYTRNNDWLILRADGKTKEDSIAISQILVTTFGSDFRGAGYSFGDDIISHRADSTVPKKDKLCGHYHIAEGWSHHMAHVIKEQY